MSSYFLRKFWSAAIGTNVFKLNSRLEFETLSTEMLV